MDSFELNKVLGALLGTCLVLLAVHIASGAIFTPTPPAKPGYEVAVQEEQPGQPGASKAPAEAPIETLLASASAQQGEQTGKVCLTCHNLGKGQGNKIGPDLYGVVGRQVASEPGFNYSAALKAKGGTWTFDALNPWLANPRADVPGTAMTFAGLSEREAARRCHRLSQFQFRQPAAAAQGGRSRAGQSTRRCRGAGRQAATGRAHRPRRATGQWRGSASQVPARRPRFGAGTGVTAPIGRCGSATAAWSRAPDAGARLHADVKSILSRPLPARWRRNRKAHNTGSFFAFSAIDWSAR